MNKDNNEDFVKIDIKKNETIYWTEQHENILAEWSDKAMCYRWMHSKSELKYSNLSKIFTIPVIIMSTLTGTANFAIDRLPINYQQYAQIGIGSVNLLAGIITTVQQFLKINELNESHRVASISWGKFHRNIKAELLKNPKERPDVTYLVKTSKEEFDRLMETSPPISESIILKFNKKFKNTSNIIKPEICDNLSSTKDIIYTPDDDNIEKNETQQIMEIIKKRKASIQKQEHIEKFIEEFKNEYSREPTMDEIIENLQEHISESIIKKWAYKTNWLKK